ncbi:MAG: HD-GYP domain-containing protein (c-di-GMP phosphodiesterase class II) [Candidatus Pseudothioglobus sp.]|jgi:HD-GYP domain-containing protein (c-di-GMP phosphodiesterase class II)
MKLQLSLIEAFYAEQEFAVFSVVDTAVDTAVATAGATAGAAADTGAVKYVAAKDSSTFMCLVEPPAWFQQFAPGIALGELGNPADKLPYLGNFLHDASAFWESQSLGKLASGPWVERDEQGGEWPLEAIALTVQGERLLQIKHLGEKYNGQRRQLQTAGENLLTQEQLELAVLSRTREIKQRETEIALRLITAACFRDEETASHIRRIGLYAAEMGRALGWSAAQIEDITLAAPMHDVGKIGISDKILLKPGKLTPDEFDIMKKHAQIGAEMLGGSGVSMLNCAAEIAGSHHEKWNGNGYPEGLKGDDIPEAARIVAIVDVYDALSHKRVYKRRFTEQETFDLMDEMAGEHLDPNLYRVFMSIIEKVRLIREQNLD